MQTFVCVAENAHGQEERSVRIVGVMPATLATANATIITRDAGSKLALECEADVDPALPQQRVSREWRKDGNALDTAGAVLEVAWLQKGHAGVYECVIRTGLEELLLVQTLKVNYSPPRLDDNMPKKKAVLRDSPLHLTCEVEAGVPAPEVNWKFVPKSGGGAATELRGGEPTSRWSTRPPPPTRAPTRAWL